MDGIELSRHLHLMLMKYLETADVSICKVDESSKVRVAGYSQCKNVIKDITLYNFINITQFHMGLDIGVIKHN